MNPHTTNKEISKHIYSLLIGAFFILMFVFIYGFRPCNNECSPSKAGFELCKQTPFSLAYIMGKFDPAMHEDFMKIPINYADQEGRYLRKEVFEAFKKMALAAKKSGHKLIIKSAARNFDNQKAIWEKKWDGITILEDNTKASDIKDSFLRAKKILLYSSMPGTSRHHWGTDFDLNAFENSYFEKGNGRKLYQWLVKNGAKYGFCQVYNSKSIRTNGYNEEKWHWSYMSTSSKILELVKTQLKNSDITGFKGAETAIQIDMVNNYILSINAECKTVN